jgi:hypothetical protein
MTHAQLQCLAQRLLKGPRREYRFPNPEREGWFIRHGVGGCAVVASEMTAGSEQADALGWSSSGTSTLIECKASRADYLRDLRKPIRNYPDGGMGMQRYYLTAPGVIRQDDDLKGWGHLEARHLEHLTKIEMLRPSAFFPCDQRAELSTLIQAIRLACGKVDHNIGRAFIHLRPWSDEDTRLAAPATPTPETP